MLFGRQTSSLNILFAHFLLHPETMAFNPNYKQIHPYLKILQEDQFSLHADLQNTKLCQEWYSLICTKQN